MKYINARLFSALTVCLLVVSSLSVVWAADEDMVSQVYLEFDPETGEFKTALDPMAQQKNQHMQAQQIEQIQQKQDNLASSGQQTQDVVAAAPDAQQPTAIDESSGSISPMVLIAGIIGLVVLVGIVALVRKNQQTA